jgi:hypothetical protein
LWSFFATVMVQEYDKIVETCWRIWVGLSANVSVLITSPYQLASDYQHRLISHSYTLLVLIASALFHLQGTNGFNSSTLSS